MTVAYVIQLLRCVRIARYHLRCGLEGRDEIDQKPPASFEKDLGIGPDVRKNVGLAVDSRNLHPPRRQAK
jgi:hypothetical protein